MFVKLVVSTILIGLCLAGQPPYHYPANDSCILVEFANLQTNTLTWTDDNNKTYDVGKWNFTGTNILPNKSKCATVNGTTATLEVQFEIDNATFTFTFTKQSNVVKIDMVLTFVPAIVFAKNNNTDTEPVIMPVAVPLRVPVTKSYQCQASQPYAVQKKEGNNTYNLNLVLEKVHMQAFGISGSKFSDAVHCQADQTTTAKPTTTPKPLTPDQHPKFSVNVKEGNNTGCILVKAEMMISVPYKTTDNKTETVKLGVQKPINVDGSCNLTNDEFIEMRFQNDFTVRITFGTDGKNVYWKNATVAGTYDAKFNKSAEQGAFSYAANFSKDTLMFSKGGSYLCDADTSLKVGNVTLDIWNLQYTAFQINSTTFPGDNIKLCKADSKTNSIVPIAVGAALAGLVVIVLIAYLIGRRRNRKGYESV